MGSIASAAGSAVGGITGGFLGGSGGLEQKMGIDPAFADQIKKSQGSFDSNYDNQNQLASMLMAQSQGQGPNIAQQQLQSATDRNIQQGAGMIASQKGINPALAARLIGQQTAAQNQEAAGQSGVMRANQQLQSQGQLSGLYGQMGNQQNTQQSNLFNANQGLNTTNAGIQKDNAAASQSAAGGMMSGLGSVASLALLSHGGQVPGQPVVPGDSEVNDKVHTMLSPGEIVIPRSQASDPNKAKAFIDSLMKQTKKKESTPKSFGEVIKSHRELKSRLEAIEQHLKKGA